MGVKVTGTQFDEYGPAFEKAIDQGLANHVIKTQAELARATPKDTARAASSWFVGKGQPSNRQAPEREGPGSVNVEKPNSNEITAKDDWFITNNLPYIERLATDTKWNKHGDWFTAIANQNQARLTREISKQLNDAIKS